MSRWPSFASVMALAPLLAACGSPAPSPAPDSPGARLETAATQAGLIADPARVPLIGSWALETDRLCVVPAARGAYRIGAVIDYGEGQGCAARGTVTRRGDRLRVAFGTCRFDAALDGDRIVFPGELPGTCDRYCTGRATLAAMRVERLSASISEAAMLRAPNGKSLCPLGD